MKNVVHKLAFPIELKQNGRLYDTINTIITFDGDAITISTRSYNGFESLNVYVTIHFNRDISDSTAKLLLELLSDSILKQFNKKKLSPI
ncbi:MAG: hypothetical protein ACXAC7_20805 [Candidatus Hodarchaeales archaeon]|jgi:hypothetical protein